jgi:hypothetical protein
VKIKARDGRTYDVGEAPPGGRHEVRLDGKLVGAFVLLEDETKVDVVAAPATDVLLVDVADRFVAAGGGPMGIA